MSTKPRQSSFVTCSSVTFSMNMVTRMTPSTAIGMLMKKIQRQER